MTKTISTTITTIFLTILTCSIVFSQATNEVRLGDFLLLRIRSVAAGFTIEERVANLQIRANDLLKSGKEYSQFTVKRVGNDANIFVDDTFFITVTAADARDNNTTCEELAKIWTNRLRTILPQSTPDKPGVGRPGQSGV